MTVILHLKPEVEAGLLAQARASGMGLEEYLLCLAEKAAFQATPANTTPTGPSAPEAAVRRMIEFGEKHHLSLGAQRPRSSARRSAS
jgi:hypothetical protein